MEIGSKSGRNVEQQGASTRDTKTFRFFFYTISKYLRDWENAIMKTLERDIIDFFIYIFICFCDDRDV